MLKIKILYLLLILKLSPDCLGFNLITTFYPEANSARRAEYYLCLKQNLKHPLIAHVHIFYENMPDQLPKIFSHPKIKLVPIVSRPSFNELFSYANVNLANQKIIIANTDIFFDSSLFKLNYYPLENKFFCLTRYNLPSYTGEWQRHIESHDAWIFQAPTRIKVPEHIKMGLPGCDIIIQRVACTTTGLEVSNPSLDIRCLHVHASDLRQHEDSYRKEFDNYPRIKLPFSHLCYPNLTWGLVQASSKIYLYAGNMSENYPNYHKFACISITKNNGTHLLYDARHKIPLTDNSVDVYQAEDVFEHIGYHYILGIINDIYRVLKPGGFCRISVPDYRCDILYERCLKDEHGKILFDPQGGGRYENGKVVDGGHLWFPKIENVKKLFDQSLFAKHGKINYLHYYDPAGRSITHPIDYSVCHVKRTPDHDPRVQNPYRAMSLVVDLYK